ncbi:hypothetical protein BCV70DRAFT_150561, partial [Testicularia cyperi]
TPQATTAAILGASSSGWSPLRTHKKSASTVSYSQSPSSALQEDQHPSSQSPRKQTQNFKALRGHGLVSNSIFKQFDVNVAGAGEPQLDSPHASPKRFSASSSPSVGLGIGVTSPTPHSRLPAEVNLDAQDDVLDENRAPFNIHTSVPSSPRRLPRKSVGRLHESNYVSNSVFRQTDGQADECLPLSPRRAAAGSTRIASPSTSKGLLTSNRLHGPRFMGGSPSSSPGQSGVRGLGSPLRQERRKTVTFDEILDVQEFDKESSFDVESVRDDNEVNHLGERSDDGQHTNQNVEHAVANPPLKVVNHAEESESSDEAQEPTSADSEPDLSTDSRETSSVEGPPSPRPFESKEHDFSFDNDLSLHTRLPEGEVLCGMERDSSFNRLSAADRVDSMVDELLKEDILNSPSLRPQQSRSDVEDLPEPLSIEALPSVTADSETLETSQRNVPQLPVWSPISLDVDVGPSFGGADINRSQTQPILEPFALSSQFDQPQGASSSNGLRPRPHISRDAILQRVAREKASQEQAQKGEAASIHETAVKRESQMRLPRGSEPGRSIDRTGALSASPRKETQSAARPSAPLMAVQDTTVTEVKPLPAPSPVKEPSTIESPLESLGTELQETAERFEPNSIANADDEKNYLLPPPVPEKERFDGTQLLDGQCEEASTTALHRGDTAPPPRAPVQHLTPAQQAEQIIARRRSKNGKGRRKRSMSTSDAPPVFTAAVESETAIISETSSHDTEHNSSIASEEEEVELMALPTRQSISADLAKSKAMLDISLQRAIDGGFQTNMEREISKIYEKVDANYKVKDRGAFQGVDDKVTHSTTAGDVDSGKAWRKVRRPSDINEYKKEMRELRESEQPRRASGKVFVMVDSFTPSDLPVPTRLTKFHCILDNGLHMVKTATVPLRPGRGVESKIGQEFELIQHKNLEFSLTLVVQRDSHLVEPQAPPSPIRKEHGSPTLKGLSRLFSSPKKQAAKREQQERAAAAELAAQVSRAEPMLAYINREGAFGRTGVVFERVASQCYARCLVLDLPVHGVSNPAMSLSGPSSIASRSHTSAMAHDFRQNLGKLRGTLRLKLFYMPPLPSVPRNRLPENLAECIRGMQNAVWHRSAPWQEGTLTQLGGDCASWRRRPVKAQSHFLICFNAVTKKPTVKIDLSKAVCIEEIGNHVNAGSMLFPSPASQAMTKSRTLASHATMCTLADEEDADANYHVDRSFRLTFADGERISFFADTEEEKSRWVSVITDIVESEVPPNPLWAQAVLETMALAGTAPTTAVNRKPSQQAYQSRRPEPTLMEESPATPRKEETRPTERAGAAQATPETPRRLTNQSCFGTSTPSRLPVRSAGSTPNQALQTGSMRAPAVAQRPASLIRTPVHDPSNRVAFERLKRAGHLRAQTEDLTPTRR